MRISFFLVLFCGAITFSASKTYAVVVVNLRNQPELLLPIISPPLPLLQTFISSARTQNPAPHSSMKKINEEVDYRGIQHIHLEQRYGNLPVWGAEAILHINKNQLTTVNGTQFLDLEKELTNPYEQVFNGERKKQAEQAALNLYQAVGSEQPPIFNLKTEEWVYINQSEGQAHAYYSYLVHFTLGLNHGHPQTNYIFVDALNPSIIHKKWSSAEQIDSKPLTYTESKLSPIDDPFNMTRFSWVQVEGLGGNVMNMRNYDGLKMDEHFPKLTMLRDMKTGICYVENDAVVVKKVIKVDEDAGLELKHISFLCPKKNANGSYYNVDTLDMVNGAYNPSYDALFLAQDVEAMYNTWFSAPYHVIYDDRGLNNPNKAMRFEMWVNFHLEDEFDFSKIGRSTNNYYEYYANAFWNNQVLAMVFGDGNNEGVFPLVMPDIVAHEMSHGFTMQHSRLAYVDESGGVNESFSDMAAMAYQMYSSQSSQWMVGKDVSKVGQPFRFMSNPTHDCLFSKYCSIDKASAVYSGIDPHLSSGVFNKAFYLLSQSWGVRKAFDMMLLANKNYWTKYSTFQEAACGVKQAAHVYNLSLDEMKKDEAVVDSAMKEVGIDTTLCQQL